MLRSRINLSFLQRSLASFKGIASTAKISEIGTKTVFSATALTHADKTIAEYDTLGDLLDKVYFARAERERVKSQAADLNVGSTMKLPN